MVQWVLRLLPLLVVSAAARSGDRQGGNRGPAATAPPKSDEEDDSVFDPIQMLEQQAADVAQEQREFVKSQIWHTAREACPEIGGACESKPTCVTEVGALVDSDSTPNETNSEEVRALHTCVTEATLKAQAERDATSPKQTKEEQRKQREAFHTQLWQRAKTECPKEAKLCQADKICTSEVYKMAMDDQEPDHESSEKVLALHHCFLNGVNRAADAESKAAPSAKDATISNAPGPISDKKCAASEERKQELAQPLDGLNLDLHGSDYTDSSSAVGSTMRKDHLSKKTNLDQKISELSTGEVSTSTQGDQAAVQHRHKAREAVLEKQTGDNAENGDSVGGSGRGKEGQTTKEKQEQEQGEQQEVEINDSETEMEWLERRFLHVTEAILEKYQGNYTQLLANVEAHFDDPLGGLTDETDGDDAEYLQDSAQRVHDLLNFLFYSHDDDHVALQGFMNTLQQQFLTTASSERGAETADATKEFSVDSVDNDDGKKYDDDDDDDDDDEEEEEEEQQQQQWGALRKKHDEQVQHHSTIIDDEEGGEGDVVALVESIFERAKIDCPAVASACSTEPACVAEVTRHATLDSTPDTRSGEVEAENEEEAERQVLTPAEQAAEDLEYEKSKAQFFKDFPNAKKQFEEQAAAGGDDIGSGGMFGLF